MNLIQRSVGLLILGLMCLASSVTAQSFHHTPDTLHFYPTSTATMTQYVYISYSGDSSGPGTYVHASLSGSSYFGSSTSTHHITATYAWAVTYTPQTTAQTGTISYTDDTVTQVVYLKAEAYTPFDAASTLTRSGDFSGVWPDSTKCDQVVLYNAGSDADTIKSIGWAHSTSVFSLSGTPSLPQTLLGSHADSFSVCFTAPHDYAGHSDSIVVHYSDVYNSNRTIILPIYASADSDAPLTPYQGGDFHNVTMGTTRCNPFILYNEGSDDDTIKSISWSHSPGTIFSISGGASLPHVYHHAQDDSMQVCFDAPHSTAIYRDTIIVHYSDPWDDTRTARWPIEAYAAPDSDVISGFSIITGYIAEMGHTVCQTGYVRNFGHDPDTITSLHWATSDSLWTVTGMPSLPQILLAGQQDTVSVCFHGPHNTAYHYNNLVLDYSDSVGHREWSVGFSGHADSTEPPWYCYSISTVDSIPWTDYGRPAHFKVVVKSHRPVSGTLTSLRLVYGDSSAFGIDSSSFPHTISAGGTDTIEMTFTPNRTSGSLTYSVDLLAYFAADSANCVTTSEYINGHQCPAAHDTAYIPFYSTGLKHLQLSGGSTTLLHRVEFINNSSDTVKVTNVGWTHFSSHFHILTEIPALVATLLPGDSIAVLIEFIHDSSGTIHDTLTVTIDHALTTISFPVDGYPGDVPPASVTNTSTQTPELNLYPNPMRGTMQIELIGVPLVTYEVMDILGNVLAKHAGASAWKWNGRTLEDEQLSAGSYFIRATGRDADNHDVTVTKRFVIEH